MQEPKKNLHQKVYKGMNELKKHHRTLDKKREDIEKELSEKRENIEELSCNVEAVKEFLDLLNSKNIFKRIFKGFLVNFKMTKLKCNMSEEAYSDMNKNYSSIVDNRDSFLTELSLASVIGMGFFPELSLVFGLSLSGSVYMLNSVVKQTIPLLIKDVTAEYNSKKEEINKLKSEIVQLEEELKKIKSDLESVSKNISEFENMLNYIRSLLELSAEENKKWQQSINECLSKKVFKECNDERLSKNPIYMPNPLKYDINPMTGSDLIEEDVEIIGKPKQFLKYRKNSN